MTKIQIAPKARRDGQNASIKISGDTLEIDLDPEKLVQKPAQAMAKAVAAEVRNSGERTADGKRQRWNNTGTLANGIRAVGGSVVAPAGRLERPELVEKFLDDIEAAANPLGQPTVQKAIAETTGEIARVVKR